MATKSMFLPTNLNNKLHAGAMIHLDLAPWATIPESLMEKNIVEIQTQDGSYPPSHWKLLDLFRVPFNKVTSVITWPSHGMDPADCYLFLKTIHPDLNSETPMAVYFYQKIV